MKFSNSNSTEDTPKSTQSKSNKKSTKSRSKSGKSSSEASASGGFANKNSSSGTNSIQSAIAGSSNSITATTPTTPTSSNVGNVFEAALASAGNSVGGGGGSATDVSASTRNHTKSYAGLEGRSIKIIWEQHDQSDLELSAEVCARVAEDASYKLWELINNIKTYARHSGGVVTYDLVNEVLADADVPPALGAMDSDWDRIDYDDSYFFFSDKILELRDEYQKDVTITMADGPDFICSWPVEDKHTELLKKYIPNLVYVALYGESNALETALNEAAFSPLIGSSYRVILTKLIQILAFKQNDAISQRCWRLLRACVFNPHTRFQFIREEYFHLAEILICQLLAPYESIKTHATKTEQPSQEQSIKMEIDEVKLEQELDNIKSEFMQQHDGFHTPSVNAQDKVYKLEQDEDEADVDVRPVMPEMSPYFASPVDWKFVDELCATVGQLAASCGYFQSECIFHITRRLERFFEGRNINTERDFNYINRAVRGLIALGEYAFREFIPFIYKFKVDEVPASLWNDFALGAIFLHGPDDIFLYEWLEFICGADKLQPFLVYYAQYFEKFLTMRFMRRKLGTYKINPKVSVRRLEWNSLAAAMCHGDDPNKALKPKPKIAEVFPELVAPNLQVNRAGTIRFKFAGCRPVIIKSKNANANDQAKLKTEPATANSTTTNSQNDILIARRRLFKPLTNERRIVPLSSYYFLRI